MSRFALDWAKQQQPGSAEGKAVLLVLGDNAEGADNECSLSEQHLAMLASISLAELPHVVAGLERAGFVETVRTSSGEHDKRTAYYLAIPETFVDPTAPHPSISGNDRGPHAVYRLYDPKGALLYVGESRCPDRRFVEHQQLQPWWFKVATREITWHPSQPLAKAEELRAIRNDHPVYNIKDSLTPPSGGEKSRRRRYVKENARWNAYTHVLGHIRSELRAGLFDIMPLPTVDDLTERHGVGWMLIKQALDALVDAGEIAYIRDADRPLKGVYIRDWSEW